MLPVRTSTQEVPLPAENSAHVDRSDKASGTPFVSKLLLGCIFAFLFRQIILERGRSLTYDLSGVDSFAVLDIAIVCLAALVLLFSGSLGQAWSAMRRTPVMWLFGYYLFCAASFIWSTAPTYSLYRAIEYLILFFATWAVVANYQDFAGGERAFLRVATATIILQMCSNLRSYGFSLYLPNWHTNSYSASSAILFCYCLGEYLAISKAERTEAKKRARRLWWFGIFSLGTLALGTSSSSNVAAAVGCLLIFLALRRLWLLLTGLWVGLLLLLWGGGGEFFRDLLFPGKSEQAIQTGTGRTVFWEYLWSRFLKSPVLGYGFALVTGGRDQILASTTHNSLFTVLIGTGLVGLAFFGTFVARLWWITIGKVWLRGPGIIGFAGASAAAFVNSLGMPLMADRWVTSSVVFVWLVGLFLLYVRGSGQVSSASRGIPRIGNGTGGATDLSI